MVFGFDSGGFLRTLYLQIKSDFPDRSYICLSTEFRMSDHQHVHSFTAVL
jgi:hypothetical protein